MPEKREQWGSRFSVILAVAGSAVGLGNFLKFSGMAASHGGGFGHGTAPGIFHQLWRQNRFIKYFGVIGIFGPIVIFSYYAVIESWTFAYSGSLGVSCLALLFCAQAVA